jgi:hypothetical protein
MEGTVVVVGGAQVKVSKPLVGFGMMSGRFMIVVPRVAKFAGFITGVGTPLTTGIPSGEFVKSPPLSAGVIVWPVLTTVLLVEVRS